MEKVFNIISYFHCNVNLYSLKASVNTLIFFTSLKVSVAVISLFETLLLSYLSYKVSTLCYF